MSKEESLLMKGVAILLMLYLHLFNQLPNVELCQNYLFVGDLPLAYVLSRATNPVAFFLIFSGYGLYTVTRKNHGYNVLKKIRNLYLHYWITLLIFIPLGAWVVGVHRYPGSLANVISNVTAWHTTWNGEIWFFFPYMLLALTSKQIFKVMDSMNPYLYFGTTLLLALTTGFCISRYGATFLYHNQLAYMPVLYLSLLFSFSLGAGLAKYNLFKKCKFGGGTALALLLLLVTLRCCFSTGAFHSMYAVLFVVLFLKLNRPSFVDSFLMEMGRRSTSMWFVHTYFAYYLFHDFIYGFKYPLLIFFVLLACSYLTAIVVDKVYDTVAKRLPS